MTASIGRRAAIGLVVAGLGCGRARERCAFCGMPLDPKSSWNAELLLPSGGKVVFDSPRCALLAWRSGQVPAKALRVQEYYERSWQDGQDLLFVASSDVTGPMGPDLVPVAPARAAEFAREHVGTRPLRLDAVTLDLLKAIH